MAASVQQHQCVQCGQAYLRGEAEKLVEGECRFHRAQGSRTSPCCGSSTPCQTGQHRSEHHCEYAYASFFTRSANLLNYVNTVDSWASVDVDDLETNTTEIASVGRVLRWTSNAGHLGDDQNYLLVRVGPSIWYTAAGHYHFHAYTPADLDTIGNSVEETTTSKLIFKSQEGSSAYSQAEWLIENRVVTGIRLSCKASCFETVAVTEVEFSALTIQLKGVKVIAEAGISEKRSKTGSHVLPGITANLDPYPNLQQVAQRPARSDFTATGPLANELVMSLSGQVLPNNRASTNGADIVAFNLSLLNMSSTNPLAVVSLTIEYKLLNDREWNLVPAASLELGHVELPSVLKPFDKILISGSFRIPLSIKSRPSFYHSYYARHKPLRLRFRIATPDQRYASLVHEHVERISDAISVAAADDKKLVLFVDDLVAVSRESVSIEASSGGNYLVEGAVYLNSKQARQFVHQSNKTGVTEFPIDCSKEGVRAFALVDSVCQTVYAVKLQFVGPLGYGQQGYLPVPDYGHNAAEGRQSELVVGQPAVEVAQLPLSPTSVTSAAELFDDNDKGFDDEQAVSTTSPSGSGAASSSSSGASFDSQRIEQALDRLTRQFETFNGYMATLVKILDKPQQ